MDPRGGKKTVDNEQSVNKQTENDSYKFDNDKKSLPQSSSSASAQETSTTSLCVVCSTRNRALALVPCGHFNVCVVCGHGLQSCPTCGSNIKGLLRVYD